MDEDYLDGRKLVEEFAADVNEATAEVHAHNFQRSNVGKNRHCDSLRQAYHEFENIHYVATITRKFALNCNACNQLGV